MLATTGRTSRQRGRRTRPSQGRAAVAGSESSRNSSNRRASAPAMANTTSSRITSTGCPPNRFTLTPLVPGPGSEDEQERGQAERGAERQEHGPAQDRRLVIDLGRDQEQHETGTDAADERRGDEPVAQRIAQRDHAHEAQAAEHHQDREQRGIVVGTRATGARGGRSRTARRRRPSTCRAATTYSSRRAHDHVRLQRGQVRGGKQPHGAGALLCLPAAPGPA